VAIAAGAGAVTLVLAANGGAATRRPTAPVVAGPRATTAGSRHVYSFSSKEPGVRASRFRYRCSLDKPKLHSCSHRLSLTLAASTHELRVQAVGPAGHQSPTAHVKVVARPPITQLHVTQLWQVHLAQARITTSSTWR
jgi:hypothetical protein